MEAALDAFPPIARKVLKTPTGFIGRELCKLAGTARAHDYPVPRHLGRYPRTHLTIQFQDRVRGPLFLGAGVGVGLGLLLPCER